MNTKIILKMSALFLMVIGLLCTFFPQEILKAIIVNGDPAFVLIVQLLGALNLGFAIQNWFVKGSLIGGIYNKPILMGNVIHFTVGVFALLKSEISYIVSGVDISFMLLILYALFALLFFMLTFFAPKTDKN